MNGLTLLGLLKISLLNLRVNWLRSFLTVIGMIFGTGAVVATLSSNEGAKKFITAELGKLGTNILSFQTTGGAGFREGDAALLRAYSPLLSSALLVTPVGGVTITQRARLAQPQAIIGVGSEFVRDLRLGLAAGRLPSSAERRDGRLVVNLGWKVAKQLFRDASPVGHSVELSRGSSRFVAEVVGVFREKGISSGIDFDSIVYLTKEVATLFDNGTAVPSIYATLVSDTDGPEAKAQALAVLTGRLPFETVKVYDAREAIERTQSIWRNQNLVGLLLAGICLLTGGIGIMNVMLLSVTQRKREVGLRKAIGATDLAISSQFLLEAVIVCFLGGLAGVIVGWLFGMRVAALLGNWEAETSVQAIGMALGFATGVGVTFGLLPALRASRMAPYDALRG